MGEVFITRKGGGGKAAAPTIAVTSVGGSFVQLAVTNNDQISQATIFLLANYDTNSATDFDLLAAQSGQVINVAAGTTVSTIVSGLDPDTSHTVSAQAAVIKKLPSNIVTTDTINLAGTGVTAPTVGPITENTFTSITFNVRNDDTVVPQIIKANITESTTVPSVYPFESSSLAALATGSITVSDLTPGTVYYIHARAFDGEFSSSNVVFGPYTQQSPIVATGGTITNYTLDEVDYRVHTFTGNGTFAVTSVPNITGFNTASILVVGGGGGGSGRHGGGGGAGGLVFVPDFNILATNSSVTIGAGGIGPVDVIDNGATRQGLNTVFGAITALGGGRPGNQTNGGNGFAGGSGGGGNYFNTNITYPGGAGNQPSQTGLSGAPYGFGSAGGSSRRVNNSSYPGGGGGGAGGVGANGNDGNGGNGGVGKFNAIISNITYNFANIFGTNYGQISGSEAYFAGGGAGGVWQTFSPGTGGLGGGGNGGTANTSPPAADGKNGTANTGGGGGGGGGNSTTHKGGNGGSGIVMIRYAVRGTI